MDPIIIISAIVAIVGWVMMALSMLAYNQQIKELTAENALLMAQLYQVRTEYLATGHIKTLDGAPRPKYGIHAMGDDPGHEYLKDDRK